MSLQDHASLATGNAVEIDGQLVGVSPLETAQPKTIMLFSDGTGNSSGKLNRTNVWRIYQALDLGVPRTAGDRIQIGRYDNGIGSSAFRPLALIQGIFGWGLKRNILSLYLFLCRNFHDGDNICLFGFSRGAFTVRVLADLIDKQGVISHLHADELDHLVADAYRAYRRAQRPRMWPMRWLVPFYKFLRDGLIRGRRKLNAQLEYGRATRFEASIGFIGVWDTVGAYGGPIQEFVRAVDDWIMPISFTDRRLPACVKTARHALALDDERDSFEPLPWDERGEKDPDRLKQVWFAGMHSDVGGGYSDDSLSYVSFNWMVREAQAAGIRFRKDRVEEAQAQADSFGPIHDSRAGPGAYYRYQPRRITALMWPPDKGGRYLIDPERLPGQGMLPPVQVHESVFHRIWSGTDGYAPITIPRAFEVVYDAAARRSAAPPCNFLNRITTPQWQALRGGAQDSIWDVVWKRRVLYFLMVLGSGAMVSMPAWAPETAPRTSGGFKELLRFPLQVVDNLTFERFHGWFDAMMLHPYATFLLPICIAILYKTSKWLESGLRKRNRAIWLGLATPAPRKSKSLIYRIRNFWVYQDILRFVRWTLLPSFVGIGILAVFLVGLLSAATLARLTWNEQQDIFCSGPWPNPAPGAEAEFWMSNDNPCNKAPIRVARHQTYAVSLSIPAGEDWYDGATEATPRGVSAGQLLDWRLDHAFVGMRRALDARWMQPLVYIVPDNGGPTRTEPLQLEYDPDLRIARGTFTARQSGHLVIAVNEAVPPWPMRPAFFYDGRRNDGDAPGAARNRGGACVRIAPEIAARRTGSIVEEKCMARGPQPRPRG